MSALAQPISPQDIRQGDRVRATYPNGDTAEFEVARITSAHISSTRNSYPRSGEGVEFELVSRWREPGLYDPTGGAGFGTGDRLKDTRFLVKTANGAWWWLDFTVAKSSPVATRVEHDLNPEAKYPSMVKVYG